MLGFLSIKSLLYLVIIGAGVYFGWSYIEALLIALPIPDPKDIKEKIMSFLPNSSGASKSQSKTSKPANAKASGYTERFD